DLQGATSGLLQEMDLGPDEIARRKEFLELLEADVERLERLNEVAEHYADDVIEHFYKHLLSFAECREFFTNPGTLEHVKRMQKGYFLRLTQGNYDQTYVQNRLGIGAVHERIGLPMKLYLGMYNFYLRSVASRIF